jgi:hypothetical protein
VDVLSAAQPPVSGTDSHVPDRYASDLRDQDVLRAGAIAEELPIGFRRRSRTDDLGTGRGVNPLERLPVLLARLANYHKRCICSCPFRRRHSDSLRPEL